RRTAHMIVDLAVYLGELFLERLAQARDAFLEPWVCAPFALTFGRHHLDDLAAAAHKIGKQTRGFVRQNAQARLGRRDEARDDRGIDRVRLGSLAQRLRDRQNIRRRGAGDHKGWPRRSARLFHHAFSAVDGFVYPGQSLTAEGNTADDAVGETVSLGFGQGGRDDQDEEILRIRAQLEFHEHRSIHDGGPFFERLHWPSLLMILGVVLANARHFALEIELERPRAWAPDTARAGGLPTLR